MKSFPLDILIFQRDRVIDNRGGGVFIAVKEDIVASSVQDLETECEIVWVKVETASCKTLYIAAYYRPNVLMVTALINWQSH